VSRSTFVRQPLTVVTARYDRMSRWYRLAEPAVALPLGMRRKAVTRLGLKPGDTVLEVGCGTGRNLRLLREAVGSSGLVLGVDASPGMLARASRLVSKHDWANVRLMQQDAARLTLDAEIDGALFSLSYSVLPDRESTLENVWEMLRPDARLVVMDAGLPANWLGRALAAIGELVARVFPGDPYSRPWEDLLRLSPLVTTERFQFGTYFICAVCKSRGTGSADRYPA
jgi:ubiquinone/menaquinone biosynthesis C-methylase UbiE